jgi:hypothetical protein
MAGLHVCYLLVGEPRVALLGQLVEPSSELVTSWSGGFGPSTIHLTVNSELKRTRGIGLFN